MYCIRCRASWEMGNVLSEIDKCPICDEDFLNAPENRGFDTILELLQFLIAHNGVDYWNNEKGINGYLNDYFPNQVETRTQVRNLLEKGFNKKMIEWYSDTPQEDLVIQEIESLAVSEHIDEYVSGIMSLLGKNKHTGTCLNQPDYYEDYAEKGIDKKYVIMALEKAVLYGADEEVALKLSIMELNVDKVQGIERLKELADNGNVNAQLKLAQIFERGEFVEKDYNKEAEYLVKAGQKKSPEGMYQLGRIYMLGRGVKRNRQKAIEMFEKASQGNHEKANYQLYVAYYDSKTGMQQKALEKLKKSADAGYVPAMYKYALHLLYGENVTENTPMAVTLLETCAKSGNIDSIEKLSYIYSVGYKVKKDRLKAWQWKAKLMGE